jgi:peptide/nickel transport system substrate-binding protein
MKFGVKSGLFIVAVTVIVGCGGPPPGLDKNSKSSTPGSSYHPDKDPTVNPPSLFAKVEGDRETSPYRDAVVSRHIIGEPRIINPVFANSWMDFFFGELCFPYHVGRKQDMSYGPTTLIESYSENEDRTICDFTLIEGLKWTDGHPYTPEDIKFTWEAILDPQVPAYFYKHLAKQIKDIEVIDDRRFRVIHKASTPTYSLNMSFPSMPKHIFGNPEERAKDPTMFNSDYYIKHNREVIVSSGPYKFKEWVTNDKIIVERWDGYVPPPAMFSKQILKVQSDRNVALLMFKKGDLDFIEMTPQQFATQTNDKDFSDVGVKAYGMRRMFGYMGWNMDGSNPFFTDVRVRRALAHAYNRERILNDVTYNLYTESNGIFDKEHWAHNPDVKILDYDLDQAGALLDEAGWLIDKDDGLRYKNIGGEKIQFKFEFIMAQSYADGKKMVEIFREDLRRLGVEFDLRILENAAFDSRNLKHDFQALVSVWEVTSDADLWRNHYHTDEIDKGRNIYSYSNKRVDELLDLTRTTFVQEERAVYFREIQQIIYDEQPCLNMWDYSMLFAFSKEMRGVNFSPAGVVLFRPGQFAWWKETSNTHE